MDGEKEPRRHLRNAQSFVLHLFRFVNAGCCRPPYRLAVRRRIAMPAVDDEGFAHQLVRMKRNADVAHWPVYLYPIFAAIGAGMDGKRLHPDVLKQADVGATVPGHEVTVQHRSGETGPRGNYYVIEISGPQIDGRWPFRSGELEILARDAHARVSGG